MSGVGQHRSQSGSGVDPYGVYNPHPVKPPAGSPVALRSGANAYQSYDHVKTAGAGAGEHQSQHQSPHISPGQQDPSEGSARKPPPVRYVDFHGGSQLVVEPEDLRLEDHRYFVGLYTANDGSAGPWEKRGKGFAGIQFQEHQGCVLLFIMSAPEPSQLVYTVCLTGLLEPLRNGPSIEWREPSAPKKVAITFQDEAMSREVYDKMCNVVQTEKTIRDPKGRAFWHCVSRQQAAVPWNDFATQLVHRVQIVRGDLDHLMVVLRVTAEEPYVTREAYTAYLAWFGEFNQAIERMRSVMKEEWFKSFATRQEAELMLNAANIPGAFLLRFSATHPGCFAMSYLEQSGQRMVIRHVLISPNATFDAYVLECADGTSLQYKSLIELVASEHAKLKFACPGRPAPPATVPSAPGSKPAQVMVFRMTPDNRWVELCTGFATCELDTSAGGYRVNVSGDRPFCALLTPDVEFSVQNEKSLVWRDRDGSRFALSFELVESCQEMFTKLSSMRGGTPESQAEAFWRSQRWASGSMIPWGQFFAALSKQAKGPIDAMADFISYILFYPEGQSKGVVSMADFVKFLAWFGPLQDCATEVANIVDQEWFHWFISREHAQELLRDKPVGTFLIRFSSQPGRFALSYADRLQESQQIVVQHTLISRDVRHGRHVLTMSKVGGGVLEYPSLKVLVDSERAKLQQPCPRTLD